MIMLKTPSDNHDEESRPGEIDKGEQPDDVVPATENEEDEETEPNIYVLDQAATSGPLREQLESAKALAEEYKELAQRMRAELINYRKRVEAERAEQRKYAIEQFIADLLPALDSLAQAEQLYAKTADGENPLLDGMRKTLKQMHKVFAQYGVEAISEANVPFDGNLHMALMIDESPEVVMPTVAEVYQQGIRIGGRVIKPAMVKVLTPGSGTGGRDNPTAEAEAAEEAGD
jgi:molecular chaperone GrpE